MAHGQICNTELIRPLFEGKRLLIPHRNKWCLGNTFDVGVIFVDKRLIVFACNFKYCRSFLFDFGFRYSGFFERGTTS